MVILGADWDTRAYERLRGVNHPIFEVDTPATQQAKIAALNKAGIDCSHVTFVETDFNQVSWFDALKQNGFDPVLPTYVLWEGGTMYLPEDAIRGTLERIAGLAPGSTIAFDYLARELVEGEGTFKFFRAWIDIAIGLTYDEYFIFGLPMGTGAREAAAAFLESSGLTLERFEMVGEDGKLSAVYGYTVGERK